MLGSLALVAATACGGAPPGSAPQSDAERLAAIEAMYEGYRSSFPGVPEVTVGELVELQERGGAVVVDVRTAEERAVSTIPGAITSEELEAEAARYRGATVVTYCTIGYRSGLYAEELAEAGWDARNLAGSILAWTHSGRPLAGPDGETRRVHVYDEQWDLTASGYEAVW